MMGRDDLARFGKRWMIVAAVVMTALGVGTLCYPAVSQLINRWNSSYAIQEFEHQLETVDDLEMEAELEKARVFNEMLCSVAGKAEKIEQAYYQTLDFGNGIMGYIQIPVIDVILPIYHGVSNEVLEKGVGHLPTSSFPIAGAGNHAVLTGHTGSPGARLFTDLEKVQKGDCFQVTVGDTHETYQVDRIKVVLPDETADLQPIPEGDYCTLVTCTPYGVNSHRLLVRGFRVDK